MMTKLVIILLSSQAEFTVSSKLNLMYLPLPQQKDCFEAIDNVREDIAIYDDKSNKWLLKDGTQFIGGFCE
jgi:two-component SAPR family response regulator|tara:strand:- start:233 stop:445 length:213 start_codon:yes stop_codon:yes gene_type:complete